jgi:hypothetical protein
MITDTQKEAICKVLTKHYSGKIIARLEKKGIKPSRSDHFTPMIIQKIVNGEYENLAVEDEIIKMMDAAKKREARKLQKLL